MGLWIAFVFVVAMFALMARIVYTTHSRGSPTKRLSLKPLGNTLIDAIDVLMAMFGWLIVPIVVDAWSGAGLLEGPLGFGLVLAAGPAAVWLRRRLLPQSLIRFDPSNGALRSVAVMSALVSLVALLFGLTSRVLEQPSAVSASFFLTASTLVVLAVWLHLEELRRPPSPGIAPTREGPDIPQTPTVPPSRWQALRTIAVALFLLTQAMAGFVGAWKDWRLERSLDLGGVESEALVTSCDSSGRAQRMVFQYSVLTARSPTPETFTGSEFGACSNVGKTIPIRYLAADPATSQVSRPWPWAPPLFFGMALTAFAVLLLSSVIEIRITMVGSQTAPLKP